MLRACRFFAVFTGNDLIERRQGVVSTEVRPAAKRAGKKVLFIDAGQNRRHTALDSAICDRRHAYGPHLGTSRLGNVYPPHRRRLITAPVDRGKGTRCPCLEFFFRCLHALAVDAS